MHLVYHFTHKLQMLKMQAHIRKHAGGKSTTLRIECMGASKNTMATSGRQQHIVESKPTQGQYVPHYLLPA